MEVIQVPILLSAAEVCYTELSDIECLRRYIMYRQGACVYFNHKWNKKAPGKGVKLYEVLTQT